MLAISLALEVAALAAALCRRAFPLALIFAYALADELLIHALQTRVLAPATLPWAGLTRAAYHLETALVLGWPALLAGTAWRRAKNTSNIQHKHRFGIIFPVFCAWAFAVGALAALYPLPKGWTGPVLHAIEGGFVAAAVVAGAVAFRLRRLRGVDAAVLGALVAVELAVATVGAWGRDVFSDWDTLARVPHGIGLTVAIVLLWRSR